MDTTASGFQQKPAQPKDLLVNDEVIVLVDDDPMIRLPIRIYFEENGMTVVEAENGREFQEILASKCVALALLDIGLPDIDGASLLPKIRKNYSDLSIIMLSGVSDLQTALECIRNGADDYLAKPVRMDEIMLAVKRNLEKRRLIIQNRQYQEDLENANFRIQLMHQLSLKMNSAYLNTVELDEILQAILVGITANEGLGFNRAFLALVDDQEKVLQGRLAIGPSCREEAGKIWGDLQHKGMALLDIVNDLKSCDCDLDDSEVNKLIKGLKIPLDQADNILITSAFERKSIQVNGGRANGYELGDLVSYLGTADFVVVPLYSPRRALGVIVADNFVTRREISESYVSALELFSSQASLVIEHSHLYMDMQNTIAELEGLNYELDKNKDMLIEAERFSALGHMAAQMVHNIRNPITAIGGISRILAKKAADQNLEKYTDVMIKETSRLESTLEDLFEFVSQTKINREPTSLYPLFKKVLLLMQPDMEKQGVEAEVKFPEYELILEIDSKLIRKMLVHLFKNAIEAMPDGGQLLIVVEPQGDWLSVSITNTGKIIDEEQIKRASEPFFTTKSYGTGMGLTMVDRIVSGHDGNFVIKRLERGTEVVVNLPIASQ